MGGGLMQLVAYGAQDIYLTGNPQITFFKVVYRRHTNFSMESIEQTFNGNPDWGKKVSCTISRNGDLIHRVYLQTTLPQVNMTSDATAVKANGVTLNEFNWVNWVGHQMIKNVEVEIGGQRIDKHYGEWLHLWNELTQSPGLQEGYARMVGNVTALVTPNGNDGGTTVTMADGSRDPSLGSHIFPKTTLYIPLQFWFCRNPGLALPLIALQYHEVKINVEFNDLNNCAQGTTGADAGAADGLRGARNYSFAKQQTAAATFRNSDTDFTLQDTALFVDYIYLDTDERRRFAQVSHEYLIEQLQFTGEESITSTSSKIKLNFNHPIKELVWVVQPNNNVNNVNKQFANFSDAVDNTFVTGATMDPLGLGMTGGLDLGLGILSGGVGYYYDIGGGGASDTTGGTGLPDLLNGSTYNYSQLDTSLITDFDVGVNPVVTAKLQLNGHDRFQERPGDYFNYVQPYQHHTNVPTLGINVYSFGLKPEEHQPSGTCNFSRIDNATLQLTVTAATINGTGRGSVYGNTTNAKIRVYATNYNVLRIMSGMGGLAYSN